MSSKKIIGIGAEAIVQKTNKNIVQKWRVAKSYRLPILDVKLRKTRTRGEAKILQTLNRQQISVPKVISSNENKMTIDMSFIEGKKLRDELNEKNYAELGKQIGTMLAKIHNLNIIHSDLTTSNMILQKKEVVLVDFGLAYFSHRTEDKAVDLHLLKQALDSYHYKIAAACFKVIITSYKKIIVDKQVTQRLGIVQMRGKNKHA